MRHLYFIDGWLWVVNGGLWAGYAHVPAMAVASFLAAILCFVVAGRVDA